MVELADAALEDFNASKWNTDLMGDDTRGNPLFKFNDAGKQILIQEPWEKNCSLVSCAAYNDVCEYLAPKQREEPSLDKLDFSSTSTTNAPRTTAFEAQAIINDQAHN